MHCGWINPGGFADCQAVSEWNPSLLNLQPLTNSFGEYEAWYFEVRDWRLGPLPSKGYAHGVQCTFGISSQKETNHLRIYGTLFCCVSKEVQPADLHVHGRPSQPGRPGSSHLAAGGRAGRRTRVPGGSAYPFSSYVTSCIPPISTQGVFNLNKIFNTAHQSSKNEHGVLTFIGLGRWLKALGGWHWASEAAGNAQTEAPGPFWVVGLENGFLLCFVFSPNVAKGHERATGGNRPCRFPDTGPVAM